MLNAFEVRRLVYRLYSAAHYVVTGPRGDIKSTKHANVVSVSRLRSVPACGYYCFCVPACAGKGDALICVPIYPGYVLYKGQFLSASEQAPTPLNWHSAKPRTLQVSIGGGYNTLPGTLSGAGGVGA